MKRVLIAHASGGLGDCLLSTVVMDSLHAAYPQATIDVLSGPSTAQVFKNHPLTSDLLIMPSSRPSIKDMIKWRSILCKKNYEVAIMLFAQSNTAFLLYSAQIPIRVGQDSRLAYSWTFTHKVRIKPAHGEDVHWCEVMLDHLRALNIPTVPPHPQFVIPKESKAKAELLMATLPLGIGPVVGMHCGKKLSLDAATWPVDKFAQWITELQQQMDARVVLTGSPGEANVVNAVEKLVKKPVLNLAGLTDVPTLAGIASLCDLYISPDSGPMHLACIVGTPTIGLFPSEEDNPTVWHPIGAPYRIVRPSPPACPPGCRRVSCTTFNCYRAVESSEILEKARQLLANESYSN